MVTVLINLDFPEVAARAAPDDVYSVTSEAVTEIARALGSGETAGTILRQHYDPETAAWDIHEVATYEVIDDSGKPITALHEVV